MSTPVIELEDIRQKYGSGIATVNALRGISLTVASGEYLAIMGPSGSGKSTLMNLLGCLDVPTSGRYLLSGEDVGSMSERQLAKIRNQRIGFVFQSFNLLQGMNALSNVELPLAYSGVGRAERKERAEAALERVGLADRKTHKPQELSGGQQQRVAIARALITEPTLLLADEPTGNLDSASTEDILGIVDELASEGRTVVLITHEDQVAERAHRVVRLGDGLITADSAKVNRRIAS